VSDLSPAAVGGFFDAAALFYQQAPWQKTADRPIQVECAQYTSSPRFAVVTGQAGVSPGLILYDDLKVLRAVQQGRSSANESADATAALIVSYGERSDLTEVELQAVQEHGYRVADEHAYPAVYRLEPGLTMRPPLPWELDLVEGCLRGVLEFLRHKTRRRGPVALTVAVSSGELPLVLSWERG
jgi:hypothetical protein